MRTYIVQDRYSKDFLGMITIDHWYKDPRSKAKAEFCKLHDVDMTRLSCRLVKGDC